MNYEEHFGTVDFTSKSNDGKLYKTVHSNALLL